MNRLTTLLLAIALLMTASGLNKSMAEASSIDSVVTQWSAVEIVAKTCCKETHGTTAPKSNSCSPLCILPASVSPVSVWSLYDRLMPPTLTQRRGVLQTKLKRPPRTTL